MKRSRQHFDEELSRVLAGENVPHGDDLSELVDLLRTESQISDSHEDLAPTLAAEAKRAPSPPDMSTARGTELLPGKWRRRAMVSTFLSSLLGKMAIGAVALATTTGSLAATGNLPDPAQDWAANQLASIGVEIPHSEDAAREDGTVLDVIEDELEDGDIDQGDQFGEKVGDVASDGESSEGLDKSNNEAPAVDDEAEANPYDDEDPNTTSDRP